MSEAELDEVFDAAWSNEGFVSRDHEEARLAAGRAALRRFREAQLQPGAVIPTYVEREFSFTLGGDRVRGRWDRVDVEPRPSRGRRPRPRPAPLDGDRPSADVVSPTLGIMGRERVTITDYKSSDVRDPAKARQRARDSLQLQIYAMGYEAMTGRLPDALALHFLESGLVGEVEVDPKRLAKARERIADGRGRACGRATTRRSPTTWPAPTARSATSARRASPADARDPPGGAPIGHSPDSTPRRHAAHRSRPGGIGAGTAGHGTERRSTMRLREPADPPVGRRRRPEGLDSLVMEARDRLRTSAFFARRGGRLAPRRRWS